MVPMDLTQASYLSSGRHMRSRLVLSIHPRTIYRSPGQEFGHGEYHPLDGGLLIFPGVGVAHQIHRKGAGVWLVSKVVRRAEEYVNEVVNEAINTAGCCRWYMNCHRPCHGYRYFGVVPDWSGCDRLVGPP
jgi:hypothetical protein